MQVYKQDNNTNENSPYLMIVGQWRILLGILLFFSMSCAAQVPQKSTVLDVRITMRVYGAETLESVIFRLEQNAGCKIGFTVYQLKPYKVKAALYNNITLREILDEQLQGTSVKYRLSRYKKTRIHLELYTSADQS